MQGFPPAVPGPVSDFHVGPLVSVPTPQAPSRQIAGPVRRATEGTTPVSAYRPAQAIAQSSPASPDVPVESPNTVINHINPVVKIQRLNSHVATEDQSRFYMQMQQNVERAQSVNNHEQRMIQKLQETIELKDEELLSLQDDFDIYHDSMEEQNEDLRQKLHDANNYAQELEHQIADLKKMRPVRSESQHVLRMKQKMQNQDDELQEMQQNMRALKGQNSSRRSRNLSNPIVGTPAHPYEAIPTSKIDKDLAEFYNKTSSVIQYTRINEGTYMFGKTQVILEIVNRSLMARTEDNWNNGKFAPILRFQQHYEKIERRRAGMEE